MTYSASRRSHNHRCIVCNRIVADGEQVIMFRLTHKKTKVCHVEPCSAKEHSPGTNYAEACRLWGISYNASCGFKSARAYCINLANGVVPMSYDDKAARDNATSAYYRQYQERRYDVNMRLGNRRYCADLYRAALARSRQARINWPRGWLLVAAAARQAGRLADARQCVTWAREARLKA